MSTEVKQCSSRGHTASAVLQQNYPNPFNRSATIDYTLAEETFVQLKVYDILGLERKNLVRARVAAGRHAVNFDASDLNSGIYFYQIGAGGFVQSKKMILVKYSASKPGFVDDGRIP